MLLHISNLFHLLYVATCWFVISAYQQKSTRTRFAAIMRLLQIIPLLFGIDLVVGFTLIDTLYGSHQSASWISKSATIFPSLLIIFVWRSFHVKRSKEVE